MLTNLVDADKLQDSIFTNSHYHPSTSEEQDELNEVKTFSLNKYKIPLEGISENKSYSVIHNDLTLDGNPTLNLASFVNTWVSQSARRLIGDNVLKNLADADEYPTLMDITQRDISILGSLWNANLDEKPIGTATTGSSEAIMLGGLALKKRWQKARLAEGKDISKPNIIMGANAQVALEKFARYFDVECRLVNVSKESRYVLDISKIEENADENTIGIFVIMGSTYTGSFENVLAVSDLLDDIQERKGLDIPIHVDGASGAMVAPFVYPELKWDFRIKRVHSINTSGHKFGLTTAGLGWIIWRDQKYLPEELIFKLRYLGGVEESFNLNFSRSGFQTVHQYFNFIRWGFSGYKKIHAKSLRNARLLSNMLEKSRFYECVSYIHRKKGVYELNEADIESNIDRQFDDESNFNPGLPVVAFKLTDDFKAQYPNVPQSLISTLLRKKGWIIPNYPLPPSEEATEILRVVVRVELSYDLLNRLVKDLIQVVEVLVKSNSLYREARSAEAGSAADSNLIYKLLNSIANDAEGLEDLEVEFKDHLENHHGSFRGTC
ncbi:hypothetical protein WICPIJ_008271 [Wickerhamomyces pijperi]|uniref:Glutamate decarboxylase n=1 Tax=Wickerhamomyces pijperi TaxID=599730 RepID=A0A9P8PZJ2_WICPI|nr:hypothetical protein WICPIJ_008271 [Wickerhamomyces pijperi]